MTLAVDVTAAQETKYQHIWQENATAEKPFSKDMVITKSQLKLPIRLIYKRRTPASPIYVIQTGRPARAFAA